MNLPGAVSTARVPERVRSLLTELNLHYAGAALLLVLNLSLVVALVFSWRSANDAGPDALAQQRTTLRLAELQARPLEGLDSKLLTATEESDTFYQRRLPSTWSQVLTELGTLTHREGVRLARVQYTQAPVLDNTAAALTEVRMDAVLTGDYRSLVGFVNSLERDRMFFLITAVTLTGQQNGIVGLRMRVNTWLRPGDPDSGLNSPGETRALQGDVDLDSSAQGRTLAVPSAVPSASAPQTPVRSAYPSGIPANARTGSAPVSEPPSYGDHFTPPPGGPPEIQSGLHRSPGGSQR